MYIVILQDMNKILMCAILSSIAQDNYIADIQSNYHVYEENKFKYACLPVVICVACVSFLVLVIVSTVYLHHSYHY